MTGRPRERGDVGEATELLRAAIKESLDLTIVNDLAVVMAHNGDHAAARALLRTCLVVDPDREDAIENVAALDKS